MVQTLALAGLAELVSRRSLRRWRAPLPTSASRVERAADQRAIRRSTQTCIAS